MNLMIGKRRLTTPSGWAASWPSSSAPSARSPAAARWPSARPCSSTGCVSKRKALGAVLIVCVVGIVALAAPSTYVNRMNSMGDYEEDEFVAPAAGLGRRPQDGASTSRSASAPTTSRRAYGRYYIPGGRQRLQGVPLDLGTRVYFRVIGEYGYPGLALLLCWIFVTFRDNRAAAPDEEASGPGLRYTGLWPALLNIGLGAYCVGGIFLGGFNYPHLFLLTGLSVGSRRAVEAKLAAMGTPTRGPPAAPAAPATRRAAPADPAGRPAAGRRRWAGPSRLLTRSTIRSCSLLAVHSAGFLRLRRLSAAARAAGASRLPPRRLGALPAPEPTVSIIVPVHNELANLPAKLANMAALVYPGRPHPRSLRLGRQHRRHRRAPRAQRGRPHLR